MNGLDLRKGFEILQLAAVDGHAHTVDGGLHLALDDAALGLDGRGDLVLDARQVTLDLLLLGGAEVAPLFRLDHGNGIVLEFHHDGDLAIGVRELCARVGLALPFRSLGNQIFQAALVARVIRSGRGHRENERQDAHSG